jgi:hypothetical protein
MSGWGALADTAAEALATVDSVTEQASPAESPPVSSAEFVSSFPDIMVEMKAQETAPDITPSHIFCGIVGHEDTGKTGIVMDAHMYRYTNGEMLWAADFDNGAMACKQAHYRDDPRIRLFSPWVMQMEDRTAYNYIATYRRIMDIGKAAIEYAENQNVEGFDGPMLKTFLVTAVDQFDSVCINNMKIYDLEMNATDAIEASAAKLNKEIGWNWSIRSTRFKQLTAICQRLNSLGVDVFWETHLKEDREGKSGFDGWKFAWEKSATNDLFQILWCKGQPMRNTDGSLTGETRYLVDFFKEKTNADLKGQERVYFVIKKGEPAQWYGLSELRDAML